ncbi:MAG: hypothetical protein KPEEDBHJ_03455 [Anaerolineales bacterium]|nr:hypothetical protein [Anaerolineales bacterium]
MADRLQARLETHRLNLGDRFVSQHLPRRDDHARSGLLDVERRDLGQDQPDAQFSRRPFYECPRNIDLGEFREGREVYVQSSSHEGLER